MESCLFSTFISCLCTRWLFMIYEDAQCPERKGCGRGGVWGVGGAWMMRPQWLIVASRVLRQMELLSLLLLQSRKLASFLKSPLNISVGNGLPNFPTLCPCISYVHINESSGGFWTRSGSGGLLYGWVMQVGRWSFYWSFFHSGSAKKPKNFSLLLLPGLELTWVCVFAFERFSFYMKLKKIKKTQTDWHVRHQVITQRCKKYLKKVTK